MDSYYQRHLDWLITMAKHPGFKDYAWKEAKRLDAEPSGMFAGIKDELLKAIGQERGLESVSPNQPKSRSVGTR